MLKVVLDLTHMPQHAYTSMHTLKCMQYMYTHRQVLLVENGELTIGR